VTRRQIALVCCAAGLVVAGAIIVVEAIENRLYPCGPPDPYFPELCMAPGWAYLGIIVACWLLATCLVAWREAIGGYACVLIGLMLWFGIAAGVILSEVVNDTPPFGAIRSWDDWFGVLQGVLIAVPTIGVFTAAVGYPLQFFIHAWRDKRIGALT
jgi:ABC-type Mn2+/Zn2+ transport system permease subunit